MTCEYARRHYGVPAEIGRRVIVSGLPGIIAADRGHHLGVNFDGDKPGVICNVHPTSDVIYEGIGTIRRKTLAQRRYAAYLCVADCYESFAAFLGVQKRPRSQ